MLTIEALVVALATACGVSPNTAALGGPALDPSAADLDDREPPDDEREDQHFCCSSVDLKNWTGEDCVAIAKENINGCLSVLYCPGKWGKHDGTVACG